MIMQGKLESKKAYTRNLIPETQCPKPETQNPKPETRYSRPRTRDLEPGTSLCGITNLVRPGSFPLES